MDSMGIVLSLSSIEDVTIKLYLMNESELVSFEFWVKLFFSYRIVVELNSLLRGPFSQFNVN